MESFHALLVEKTAVQTRQILMGTRFEHEAKLRQQTAKAEALKITRKVALETALEEERRMMKARQNLMVARFELESRLRETSSKREALKIEQSTVNFRQSMMSARFDNETKLRNRASVSKESEADLQRIVIQRRNMMVRRFNDEARLRAQLTISEDKISRKNEILLVVRKSIELKQNLLKTKLKILEVAPELDATGLTVIGEESLAIERH